MTTAIAKSEVMPPMEAPSPMSFLQAAISRGAGLEELKELMNLKDRWDETEARKSFVAAMAAFKKEAILITKDKENKQYGSRYTSIGNLVNTVTPFLSKHGLSAEWHLDQTDGIKVGCTITHYLGHSGETKWMKVPLDTSGAKNPLQQTKSSVTYAKISTFELACGLASSDSNLDDDGNGSGKAMAQEDYAYHREQLEAAATMPELQKVFAKAYTAAKGAGDENAQKGLTNLYEERKRVVAR